MSRIRTAAVALATSAALVVSGLVAGPASAATTTVTLTGPSSAYQGTSTKLTTTWKVGGVGHKGTVTIQQKVNGVWYVLGTTTTSSAGTGTISVKPKATAVFRAKTSSGTYSATKTLTIKPPYAISAKASATSIAKGKSATLTATYTHLGAKVASGTLTLQRKSGSTWVKQASVKVAKGAGTASVKPTATTSYRFTVSGKATSGTVTVKVTSATPAAPSKFTVHGSGYGHGVGMPQYGAYQMALTGHTSSTILSTYYKGSSTKTVTTPSTIGVQVWGPEPYGYSAGTYSDTAKTTTVSIDKGTWRLRSAAGSTLYEGAAPVTVTVGVSGSKVTAKFTVKSGTKTVTKSYSDTTLRMHWSGTRYYKSTSTKAVATVKGAQGTYRNGRLTLTAVSGHPNIVNDVLLNTEYLYGIAEMPSSWGSGKGESALAAQAIVARSYALTKLGSVNSKCRCNVVDDVRDQNYTGWKKQNEGTSGVYGKLWVAAVNATETSSTRAKVLTYGGKPVVAHYYSSSGGRTASSQDVWSATLAYEQSVADPYSKAAPGNSYKSWTHTLTQAQAKSLFGVSNIKSIAVTAKYSSGQAKTLTATTTSGTKKSISGKADAMRSKLGLPGAWITSISAG